MNLLTLLRSAQDGAGLKSAAARFGLDETQTDEIVRAALPALSSGLKRQLASGDGAGALAQRLRDTDAETLFAAPDAHGAEAEVKGGEFLNALFGGARADVEQAVSERAAERAGVDQSTAQSMLPMLAAMVLGGLQNRESNDGALSAAVSGLMTGGGGAESGLGGLIGGVMNALGGGADGGRDGAGAAGGFDLSSLNALFDADGDGSAADDLLDRFMGKND